MLDAVVFRLRLPPVVKPAQGGSPLGVSIVADRVSFVRTILARFAYGTTASIEPFVIGGELAVAVISTEDGHAVRPVVETVAGDLYDFDPRSNLGRTQHSTPARVSPQTLASATACALLAHNTLGLQHISRINIIFSENGLPQFVEANVARGIAKRHCSLGSCGLREVPSQPSLRCG